MPKNVRLNLKEKEYLSEYTESDRLKRNLYHRWFHRRRRVTLDPYTDDLSKNIVTEDYKFSEGDGKTFNSYCTLKVIWTFKKPIHPLNFLEDERDVTHRWNKLILRYDEDVPSKPLEAFDWVENKESTILLNFFRYTTPIFDFFEYRDVEDFNDMLKDQYLHTPFEDLELLGRRSDLLPEKCKVDLVDGVIFPYYIEKAEFKRDESY